ncbi:hypothetical protein [Sporosarcina sp. FSL W7-1283]|uniref:hypothetical protein n=1 Tax=Sporosarcina sp. FSL W7-1283 TaxID=2921560 RepID=UPI0030FA6625
MSNKNKETNKNTTASSPTKKVGSKPRAKTLNMKMIDKQFNDLSKLTTYTLDPKENLVVKYYEKFDEVKIQELLQLAYKHLEYVREKELPYFQSDDEFMIFVQYLIIYKFATVVDEESEDFEPHINIMNKLISTGLYRVFLEDIFDPNEVMKVLDRLKEFQNLIEKIGALTFETQKELESTLQNKEIIDGAFGKKNTDNPIHPLVDPYGDESNGKI